MEGATFIKTPNGDKASRGETFISFVVNQDETVYVAYYDRVTPKPNWMQSFADKGKDIITSDTTLSIFAKDFSVGNIILGGNEGGGCSMYTVIIVPQGNPPPPDTTTLLAPPTG